jgi:hypothetical protein
MFSLSYSFLAMPLKVPHMMSEKTLSLSQCEFRQWSRTPLLCTKSTVCCGDWVVLYACYKEL